MVRWWASNIITKRAHGGVRFQYFLESPRGDEESRPSSRGGLQTDGSEGGGEGKKVIALFL